MLSLLNPLCWPVWSVFWLFFSHPFNRILTFFHRQQDTQQQPEKDVEKDDGDSGAQIVSFFLDLVAV